MQATISRAMGPCIKDGHGAQHGPQIAVLSKDSLPFGVPERLIIAPESYGFL